MPFCMTVLGKEASSIEILHCQFLEECSAAVAGLAAGAILAIGKTMLFRTKMVVCTLD